MFPDNLRIPLDTLSITRLTPWSDWWKQTVSGPVTAPFRWPFSCLPAVSLQGCTGQYSAEDSVRSSPPPPSFQFSSLVFCPATSSHHVLLRLPALFSQLRETTGLLSGSPTCAAAWKLSRQQVEATIRLTSSVSSFEDHCPAPPGIHVQNPVLLYFVELLVSGSRVNLVPVKLF